MYLGIDTSTRWLNLAVLSPRGDILAEFSESLPTHTTRLAPEIRSILERAGGSPRDLVALGAVVGPGSFTGLRVGLAAAAGLAQALGIPAFGLSSLEALAMACRKDGTGLALLDARRAEVYVQPFRKEGVHLESRGEPASLGPSAVTVDGQTWAIGDGVPLVPAWPKECALFPEIPNLALPAARNARIRHQAGEEAPPLLALYVRPPDVREPRGCPCV